MKQPTPYLANQQSHLPASCIYCGIVRPRLCTLHTPGETLTGDCVWAPPFRRRLVARSLWPHHQPARHPLCDHTSIHHPQKTTLLHQFHCLNIPYNYDKYQRNSQPRLLFRTHHHSSQLCPSELQNNCTKSNNESLSARSDTSAPVAFQLHLRDLWADRTRYSTSSSEHCTYIACQGQQDPDCGTPVHPLASAIDNYEPTLAPDETSISPRDYNLTRCLTAATPHPATVSGVPPSQATPSPPSSPATTASPVPPPSPSNPTPTPSPLQPQPPPAEECPSQQSDSLARHPSRPPDSASPAMLDEAASRPTAPTTPSMRAPSTTMSTDLPHAACRLHLSPDG
jgi:hypothetical protein